MGHDDLDGLGLAGPGLTGDQYGLVRVVDGEAAVRLRGRLVHVRGQAGSGILPVSSLAVSAAVFPPNEPVDVLLADLIVVQSVDPSEGIHRNDDIADAGIGQAVVMTGPQIVQYRRLVQRGEVAHVLPHNLGAGLIDVLEGQG